MAHLWAGRAIGEYLTLVAGWLVVLIGVASKGAAIAYTGGLFPFGYLGLGDLFVFIFFGLVATCSTYFVQAGDKITQAINNAHAMSQIAKLQDYSMASGFTHEDCVKIPGGGYSLTHFRPYATFMSYSSKNQQILYSCRRLGCKVVQLEAMKIR